MISLKRKGRVGGSAGDQGLAHLSWTCSCFWSQVLDWLGLRGGHWSKMASVGMTRQSPTWPLILQARLVHVAEARSQQGTEG